MEEIWKDVKGYEGYYQVSNLGRVRSTDRDVTYFNGTIHHYKSRIIKAGENYQGYLHVNLRNQTKTQCVGVHRLVALHFVDGYADGLEVNHIDENKKNNRADNLEWCTPDYNKHYGTNAQRWLEQFTQQPYLKRTKTLEVYKDGELVGEFNGYKEVAEALGITVDYASQIANGRKNKHYTIVEKKPRSYQVAQYLDDELVAIYPSISSATRAVKGHHRMVRYAAQRGKMYHGYTWRML